jgi:hypothetical protein
MSPLQTSAAEVAAFQEIWRQHIDAHANPMHVLFSRQIDLCFDEIFGFARAEPHTDDMRAMIDDLMANGVKIERRPEPLVFTMVGSGRSVDRVIYDYRTVYVTLADGDW